MQSNNQSIGHWGEAQLARYVQTQIARNVPTSPRSSTQQRAFIHDRMTFSAGNFKSADTHVTRPRLGGLAINGVPIVTTNNTYADKASLVSQDFSAPITTPSYLVSGGILPDGAFLQGGSTYSGGNNWMTGMVSGSLYYDGANWQNKTYGGNNGWAMIGFGGASNPGEVNFYSVGATGAVDRSYTPAQIQALKMLTIKSNGVLVGGLAQNTYLTPTAVEAGSLQIDGANNWGVLYLGSTAGGYIRPFGGGLRVADGGSASVAQIGFFGAAPIARPTAGGVTQTVRGVGTTWLVDNTTTGNVGATAYTIQDVVAALKNLGLLVA